MANEDTSGATVLVVGAGIAGLVAAKVLRSDGFHVRVIEKAADLGGIWSAARTYPGLRANSPRELFAFSDLPYPDGTEDFPTANEVRTYLDRYAATFNLRTCIEFSTQVTSISRAGNGAGRQDRFRVTTAPAFGTAKPEAELFDHVAICNGVFARPELPQVPGQDAFRGAILHSGEFVDAGVVEGKRVVVVGGGKSAFDCASIAAAKSASCTLVIRSPHWMVPRFFGRLRMDRLLATRFSESLLPTYHHPKRTEVFMHGAARPIVQQFWRIQNKLIPRVCGMPPELVPKMPLPSGLEKSGVGDEFYRLVDQKRVTVRPGRIASFTDPNTVQLDTGEEIEAEVVVFATGWRPDVSFLDQELQHIVSPNGAFRLYRHILPPPETKLGFIGYASSTACPLVSEISAHWLSQVFRGEMRLPSVDAMGLDVDRLLQWNASVYPGRTGGYFIGLYVSHFIDDLVRDMGLPTRRKGDVISEYLQPFWAERYSNLAMERLELRKHL